MEEDWEMDETDNRRNWMNKRVTWRKKFVVDPWDRTAAAIEYETEVEVE